MQAVSSAMPTSSAENSEVVTVSRRVRVNITGSIDKFNRTGIEAATWTPVSGKQGEVFGVHEMFDTTPDATVTSAALQNAVVHKITCLQQHNDFPVHVGVNISCITPEESTRSGHKYAMTCLAKKSVDYPMVVFEAEERSEGVQWRSKYPKYNANNLEREGILDVNGQQYIFCSKDHPVIELLRQNKEILNANIDDQQMIDGEWLKLTRQVFSTCCQTLRTKVLNNVSTRDLNNFSVQISPIGKDDWSTNMQANDEMLSFIDTATLVNSGDKNGQDAMKLAVTGLLQKTCTYSALLEIQYDMSIPT